MPPYAQAGLTLKDVGDERIDLMSAPPSLPTHSLESDESTIQSLPDHKTSIRKASQPVTWGIY